MKYIWLIPMFFPLIMVLAMPYIKDTEVMICDSMWIVETVNVNCSNGTRTTEMNIAFSESTDNSPYPALQPRKPIYKIMITCNCTNSTSNECNNEPMILVDSVDCNSSNLTLSTNELCTLAEELGKWDLASQLMHWRYREIGEFEEFPILWACVDAESCEYNDECTECFI